VTALVAQGSPCPAAALEEMERFRARYAPQSGSPWHSVATAERIALLAAERTTRLLTGPKTRTILSRENEELVGLVCWTRLDWDTEQFGFPAARLDLLTASGDRQSAGRTKTDLVDDALQECRNHDIRHVTARVDAGDLTSVGALERNGFELIDGIQTFSLRIPSAPIAVRNSAESITVRLYQESDLPQVLQIARSAYVYDRFHADSALDEETADRINETWVRNSCLGTMADAVIIATAGDAVLGYVTCQIDKEATRVLGVGCGEIGMVATTSRMRNAGVASAATVRALEWFEAQGVSAVEVGTQLRNIGAARLYEGCGFRLTAASLTLRKVM
jgi:dTDP-4-amino-4,6-dideoxy-D-galactose acyltransferase